MGSYGDGRPLGAYDEDGGDRCESSEGLPRVSSEDDLAELKPFGAYRDPAMVVGIDCGADVA